MRAPTLSAPVVRVAFPFAARVPVPSSTPPSKKLTLPVGVPEAMLTVAVNVTGWPKDDGFRLLVRTVVLGAVKLISRTGCNSMPLGATPVCPWRKSKNPTPFI